MSVDSQKKNELDSHKGEPDAGTKSVPRKAQSETGQATPYAFSTNTPVKDAKDVPGTAKRCADIQEGQNKSKLLPSSPPSGSSLKDGEEHEFEKTVIGTP
jgi:hypothetical protein